MAVTIITNNNVALAVYIVKMMMMVAMTIGQLLTSDEELDKIKKKTGSTTDHHIKHPSFPVQI